MESTVYMQPYAVSYVCNYVILYRYLVYLTSGDPLYHGQSLKSIFWLIFNYNLVHSDDFPTLNNNIQVPKTVAKAMKTLSMIKRSLQKTLML